ncbi:SDR family oxidoreductase [Xanthocytophaga agilis]|uniref:SDR family oxidoreductase n=1 Tax=Xanthocytophaga agilis TaxID=3048010 RepID=A0AAE3RDV5_9BACT|nr:SDR family oxidoreductase [Xanthocytophaga agilis]MDJ1505988.1 SDR family oxidoreductase [Xanthocytophaga agilis]
MSNKICLITGANSGIGKVTARELAKAGMDIILVCRNEAKGKETLAELRLLAKGKLDLFVCDLANQESIVQLAQQIYASYDHLDLLINNAGLILDKPGLTPEGFESTFGINHLGTFLLTNLLLDLLKKGNEARIVTVSSDAHKWSKWNLNEVAHAAHFKSLTAYANSKLANILFTRELAKRVKEFGITANSLHPGAVQTNFGAGTQNGWFVSLFNLARPFFLTPEQGAQTSIYLATSPEVKGVSGLYFVKKRPKTPSKEAQSDLNAQQLWQKSEEWTQLPKRLKELQKVS